MVTADELSGLHPAHAAYVYAYSQVAELSSAIMGLKEMEPFSRIIDKAEDLYQPSGPPMSPLTNSYFMCWSLFDVCAGRAKETIGSVVLQIGEALGIPADLLRLIRLLQGSRMGLYVQTAVRGDLVVLEEVFTGRSCHAISPAGHRGRKGELWYARVLPPPFAAHSEHVVFTTPYIVLRPGVDDWRAYFNRTCKDVHAYERHMKFGPTRQYWNDYVFEAYVNHRSEVIYLAGMPDVAESRPHSKVNGWGFA